MSWSAAFATASIASSLALLNVRLAIGFGSVGRQRGRMKHGVQVRPLAGRQHVRDDAGGVECAAAFPIHAYLAVPGRAFVAAFEPAYGVGHFLDKLIHPQHSAHLLDEAVAVRFALLGQKEALCDTDGVERVLVNVEVTQLVFGRLDVWHHGSLSFAGAA